MTLAQEIRKLIDAVPQHVDLPPGATDLQIVEAEQRLGKEFPDDYRRFLKEVGPFRIGELTVFGVGDPPPIPGVDILRCHQALREIGGASVPEDLIPIARLGRESYVCLDFAQGAAIIRWELLTPSDDQDLSPIAANFEGFLTAWLPEEGHRANSFKLFEKCVGVFYDEYLKVGRLPRNDVWRPYRFCSQDVVVGLVVVKHSLDDNCLLVDVCLAFDPPQFQQNSGSKMTAIILLSEAYKCGGSMELRFSENVEGGRVPRCVRDLAMRANLSLLHAESGRITPAEARSLYLAISDFSPSVTTSIYALADHGRLSKERACYVVHHGVWTRPELEAIVRGSPNPDAILAGDVAEEHRHAFVDLMHYTRATVLGGLLDRRLGRRERSTESGAIELEDDTLPLDIGFDPTVYAKTYASRESIVIPWQVGATTPTESSIGRLTVLVRARNTTDIMLHFDEDLAVAASLPPVSGEPVAILFPRDFDELPRARREQFLVNASKEQVSILVCPDATFALDLEARRRLHSSRILRQ